VGSEKSQQMFRNLTLLLEPIRNKAFVYFWIFAKRTNLGEPVIATNTPKWALPTICHHNPRSNQKIHQSAMSKQTSCFVIAAMPMFAPNYSCKGNEPTSMSRDKTIFQREK